MTCKVSELRTCLFLSRVMSYPDLLGRDNDKQLNMLIEQFSLIKSLPLKTTIGKNDKLMQALFIVE